MPAITTSTLSMREQLLGLSDEAWQRTRRRLEGLTDDEYLWEPYPGCWTVRQLADGSWIADWVNPAPQPPPLTTIAWRMVHLIGCYGGARNSTWLGVEVEEPPVGYATMGTPATAPAAVAQLERAHRRWRSILEVVSDATLAEPIGPIGGQYAEHAKAALLLHTLDEVIHHAAEVAVLRDLYRARSSHLHPDPVVARLLAGDRLVLDELVDGQPDGGSNVVGHLAAAGRWDLVEAAVARGLPVDGPPPTALHHATSTGNVHLVQLLLEAGADRSVIDPQFRATPAEWADYFGHTDLVPLLQPGGEAA